MFLLYSTVEIETLLNKIQVEIEVENNLNIVEKGEYQVLSSLRLRSHDAGTF